MGSWLLIRRLRGPAFLILVGITALLNQWGVLSFSHSWPLYLILAGVLAVLERAAVGTTQPVVPAGYSPAQTQLYYRRSLRRPSMVGPVVLLIVGVVALLVETNQLNGFHLWDWYLRWWPLLLIGVGLLSLGEWLFDRNYAGSQANGPVPLGRRSHGGLIALVICLAIIGYLVNYSHGLHGMHIFDRDGERDDLFSHLMGQEHDDDSNLNQQIPARAAIDIQVPHGDVTVSPSGDDQIHVQAHLVVYSGSDRDARHKLQALTPQLTVNGQNVTLRAADSNDGRADLIVEIPKGSVLAVTAGHGDVTIESLPGTTGVAAKVSADRGDVKIENTAGGVQVRMGKGDFNAHAVSGDVSLQGKLDDVSISDVQGRVVLDGDFFGDTHLAHVVSGVHFHSSRTDVEVVALPGDLSIDSGDLQLNNAQGPAKITTSAKDVESSGVTGDLRVEDGDGDISVGAVKPMGELHIHNRNGAINLSVPEGAGFQLQATAKNGDIDSKLSLPVNSSGDSHSITGQVGAGGPSVELMSDHGDIEITITDVAPPAPPVPPVPPVPPLPPLPPGGKIRHFHAPPTPGPSEKPIVQQ
jgi:DUF4097 and DUF4098 domain-containing protein YvlB